ncbi:peptide ABC transporter ATPase [Lysinibacillus sp. SGAir0095]|uniref:tubby C-terminal domain-like protein n=1 Tax=Lysinibacillus sp. SGAir0095 TaxID=2070463 RepID=UPI0010CCB6BF|nr:peptide ABC transporter ATPase [Lysinibacillus sp. SGAir0095]QCR32295.1 peptide ABC transporter ATPase [Lysinibacillus sp. SGAir0095]
MKKYTYSHPEAIEYTGEVPIMDENGHVIAYSKRIYDNFLKRTFDEMFDFRYFLKYDVLDKNKERLFSVKKISRRGKLWFEGFEVASRKKYIISYENWRIGIPTLYITDGKFKIQLEKELEDWSSFLLDEEVIAKWKAEYREKEGDFQMTLQINENSPIQQPEFFIAISQATLFVGA